MNKSILITGASKGIGAATAWHFWENENTVQEFILLARESKDFDSLIEDLKKNNPYNKKVTPYFIDLADRDALVGLMSEIYEAHGNVDILLNNAGYTAPCALQQISFKNFERTISVNLYAPFTVVQELLHQGNVFKVILNVASTAGINGRSGWLTYSASKAAVINMSEVMREELAIYGTRVVCLAPGRCATGLRRKLAPDEDPTAIMQPEHVAEVVDMLCSEAGRFIDSQRIVVRL